MFAVKLFQDWLVSSIWGETGRHALSYIFSLYVNALAKENKQADLGILIDDMNFSIFYMLMTLWWLLRFIYKNSNIRSLWCSKLRLALNSEKSN